MSRIVISSHNDHTLNDERKSKFMINYSALIKSKVSLVDTKQHGKTTTNRHLKRVTAKVVEDLLEELPEIGYVTRKQQQLYSSKLIPLDKPVHKNLWKAELERLDGIKKLNELKSITINDKNLESTSKRPKKRKLKSVVTKILYEKPKVDSTILINGECDCLDLDFINDII
jgi:hypothetical protein